MNPPPNRNFRFRFIHRIHLCADREVELLLPPLLLSRRQKSALSSLHPQSRTFPKHKHDGSVLIATRLQMAEGHQMQWTVQLQAAALKYSFPTRTPGKFAMKFDSLLVCSVGSGCLLSRNQYYARMRWASCTIPHQWFVHGKCLSAGE